MSKEIVCKHCHRPWDMHGFDEQCLKYKDGEPTGFRETVFTPKLPRGYNTKQHLMELVKHCWLYSGYPSNGYQKMSMEMKALYKHCTESETE